MGSFSKSMQGGVPSWVGNQILYCCWLEGQFSNTLGSTCLACFKGTMGKLVLTSHFCRFVFWLKLGSWYRHSAFSLDGWKTAHSEKSLFTASLWRGLCALVKIKTLTKFRQALALVKYGVRMELLMTSETLRVEAACQSNMLAYLRVELRRLETFGPASPSTQTACQTVRLQPTVYLWRVCCR